MSTSGPGASGGRGVAVLIEPPDDLAALKYATALSPAESLLITLVPRPRLLRGPIHLAGFDPDELADQASAAMESQVHRLIEALTPGLPHLVVKVGSRHLAHSVRLSKSYGCSTLVLPRRVRVRARLTRRKARRAGVTIVVAP